MPTESLGSLFGIGAERGTDWLRRRILDSAHWEQPIEDSPGGIRGIDSLPPHLRNPEDIA
jgi:hypothetical protein